MRCNVLEEVKALQQQLHDAQHPEVGTMPGQVCPRDTRITLACLKVSKAAQQKSEQSMRCRLMLHPCGLKQQ